MSTGGSRSSSSSSLPYPNDQVHGDGRANHEEWIRTDTMFQYSFPYPANLVFQNTGIALTSQWSPSALGSSFRGTSHSPLRILILDSIARDANQRPRRTIPESPQRFIGPSPMSVPTASQDESILIHEEEQKDVLKKLKKEIYNPMPKKIIQRLNLYYRDSSRNNSNTGKVKDDEDDKRCAVCLEDFQPKEVVMLTPCSHMFHEDCIVPWVKSSGKCPVCRFAICERIRERRSPSNNNAVDWTSNDPFTGALISFIRAVDEPRGESTRGPNSPLWF